MDKIIDECVTYIVGAERPYWQDDGGFPDDVKQYILELSLIHISEPTRPY